LYLQTRRLLLRKFQEADFADFHAYANDPEMCRMMGRDDMSDPAAARFTFDWLKDREERGYALVLLSTGRVIGNLTVTAASPGVVRHPVLENKRGCALSFSLSRQYQRRGLMEEALRAVLERLLGPEGMDYVNCGHFSFNHASEALQKKLGFTPLLTEQVETAEGPVLCIENILFA